MIWREKEWNILYSNNRDDFILKKMEAHYVYELDFDILI